MITIQSFNGIGDLLFVTPTLRSIKKAFPGIKIVVNTNYPQLLHGNPYVDTIGSKREGIFLGYPDPIHGKNPTEHHIISDWRIICKETGLDIPRPKLQPEIYLLRSTEKIDRIGVQVLHKGHWYKKKVWPGFQQLASMSIFEPIPKTRSIFDLILQISKYRAVVCAEGGISHIAKALNIPAIVIYGGFAHPDWNGYKDQINIVNEKSCSYCYNAQPCAHPFNERECMKEITIKDVLQAVSGLQKVEYLTHGQRAKEIVHDADIWCKGWGIDVGGGNCPYPNAYRTVELTKDEDAYRIKESSNSLDFVFSSHCLEHLEEPSRALFEWKRVLKENGILFLYLPHKDYLPWRPANNRYHKHSFEERDVITLLIEQGFQIQEVALKNSNFSFTIVARKAENI